jgi:hypothetical protein
MSIELRTAIDNAKYMLATAIPALADGTFGELAHAHGIATTFRSRGVSELLLRGVVDPLHVAQMQSTSVYVFALRRTTDEDEKVTSLGGCLWDAVSAQYWDAAREIAAQSRMTHNPKREHEDDFLYVAFLMQRYFLAPPADAPAEALEAHAQAQQQRLDRWAELTDGALDRRLSLCQALSDGDPKAFEDAIVAMADQRDEGLLRRHKQGKLTHAELAWLLPIWPEGLALLRLAARDELTLPGLEVPRVPSVMRVDNDYRYDPNAWRSPDFRPAKRS